MNPKTDQLDLTGGAQLLLCFIAALCGVLWVDEPFGISSMIAVATTCVVLFFWILLFRQRAPNVWVNLFLGSFCVAFFVQWVVTSTLVTDFTQGSIQDNYMLPFFGALIVLPIVRWRFGQMPTS